MSKASRNTKRARRSRRTHLRRWRLGGGAAALVLAAAAGFLLFGRAQPEAGGAPDFTMVAYQGQDVLGGDRVSFAPLVGRGKPVVLNIWAGLCPPCRAEMPGFERVYRDLGARFVMVGLDVGPYVGLGSHDDARAFLRDNSITYPTAYATSSAPLQGYGVQGMPTTVLFDASGALVAKHTGYFDETGFRKQLETLLARAEASPGDSP
jgi:thiol-disulfide isomerase/thioredoxin